jgi:hypothetical protein
MKLLLGLLLAMPLSVFAATETPLELKKAVAGDIQALAWDTVNEGIATALVVYKNDVPEVSCKISPSRQKPGHNWAFCAVEFEITDEYHEEPTSRTCDLLYSYDPANITNSLTRDGGVSDRDTTSACIEYLGEELD